MILTYAKRRRESSLAPFGTRRRVRTDMGYRFEKKVPPYGTATIDGDVDQSPRGIGGELDTSQEVPGGRTANGVAVSQSIQWSSEYHDPELALVYYNYRYYNPQDGRWTRRDYLPVRYEHNSYRFAINATTTYIDIYGLFAAEAAVASGFVAANGAAASAVASAAAAAAPVVVVVGIVALTVWGVYTIVNNIEDDATVDEIESVEVTNTTFNYTECEIWCRKNYYACLNIKYYNKGCPLSAWIECNAAYDACLFGCSMGKWPTE